MKNSVKIFILFFSITCIGVTVSKSQSKTDSLFEVLKNVQNPQEKTDILFQIADELQYINIDSAILFLNDALNIASSNKLDEYIKKILIQRGRLYLYSSNTIDAFADFDKCLVFANATNDKKTQGTILHLKAYSYFIDYDYPNALDHYFEALNIRESINDSTGIAATKNNIGLIFWQLHQYHKALKYLKESLDIGIKYNDYNVIGSGYSNIAIIYSQIDKIDSSNIYFKKSLSISFKAGDPMYISSDYTNIGANYILQQQYDSAKYYLTKAYNIEKNIGREFYLATITSNLSDYYYVNNMYDSAIYYNLFAEQKSLKIRAIDLLEYLYDIRAKIYFDQKKFKEAYIFSRIHNQYKDSLYNENIADRIATLENQFTLEKKQEEIDFQDLLLQQQKLEIDTQKKSMLYLKLFIISLIVLGFIVVWIFIKNIKAYKLLQIKSEKIENQNKKIEEQNKVISNYNEEIKASLRYAGDIVTALLPQQSELEKKFDIFTIFYPKEIVSGDFYQYFDISDGHIFVVGDCSGHGVPGALLATLTMRILNRIIHSYNIDEPNEIIKRLDTEFKKTLKHDKELNADGVDIGIIKISSCKKNKDKIEVNFSGAHRDLYFYNEEENSIDKISGARGFVGGPLFVKQNFNSQKLMLNKETKFYIFSDGFVDQSNNDRTKIGTKRLRSKILEFAPLEIANQKKEFEMFFNNWKQEHFQIDDVTFVGFKIKNV